jgi:hypothetical protein
VLLASACAFEIGFDEPTGEYAYGTIPVVARFTNDSHAITNASLKAELLKGKVILDTKQMTRSGDKYTSSFSIEESGTYAIKASTSYGETLYENSTSFEVNSSKISLVIASPENKTYAASPPLKASVTAAKQFVHDATVNAIVYRSDVKYAELELPEGRNYYEQSTSLVPGFYKVVVTASSGGQKISGSVEFTITGEVNGTFIPGNMLLEIARAPPLANKYATGTKTEINVVLVDKASGQKLRKPEADVEARVLTPSATKEIKLAYKDDAVNPTYSTPLLLDEKGWYEIIIKASLQGYSNATLLFPPLKSGEEPLQLPADMGCANSMCLKLHAPASGETFPANETVKVRVQLLEDVEEHPPISGAKITARTGAEKAELSYEKNGYYTGELGPLQNGEYGLTVTADWQGKSVANTTSFTVSPDKLLIELVYPAQGENVTEEFITIQARVVDQGGEVVAGANARAIVTTPTNALHEAILERNAETGNYEASYTFSEGGAHKVKVVASKQGFVSASKEFSFDHWVAEQKPFSVSEQDILLIALLVGIIIVLLAVWKAFI